MNRFILNETSFHGKGAISAIPAEFENRGYKKAFITTDPELFALGIHKKVTDLLDNAKIAYTVYCDIKPNPTVENVRHGVHEFKNSGADCILAIGGGSSIDTAKAIGIVANNPEFDDILSLEGVAKTKNPAVPIIAVPTTAGTAAEVTINYVITDNENKRKFVCVDTHDIPTVAVVDPSMMETMPKSLAAATGMDALTHAIEGYITKGAWELSDMFHIKAIEIIGKNLREAVSGNKKAIEEMALGQYIAGMGFSNVGLGVDHSMAHTLSSFYDMPHGEACAILLPTVMEYNAEFSGEKYRDIAKALGVKDTENMKRDEYRRNAIETVRKLSRDVGIPQSLSGILKESDIDVLSKNAYEDACRPGNPREVSISDIKKMFASLS